MNESILSYQGVKFHVVPMIDVVYLCRRFTFAGFKIVLHFRVVLHLWKNRFTFVGVLRWWAGLRLTALQWETTSYCPSYVIKPCIV